MIGDFENRAACSRDDERKCWEIVDYVNSIILRWDTGMRITFANRFAHEFFGFGPGELIGRGLVGTIVPHTSAAGSDLEALLREIVRHPGEFVNNENENVRRDGSRAWIAWTNQAIRDPEGNVCEIISVGNDVTGHRAMWQDLEQRVLDRTRELEEANESLRREALEHRRDEEALRESEERFRATFEQAAVGIAHVALDGQFVRVNQKYCEIVGYTCGELTRLTYQDITYPPDARTDEEVATGLLAGRKPTFTVEKRYVRKDGVLVWVSMTVSLLHDANGSPKYYITVIQDITQRKQAEEAMGRARSRAELYLDLMGHDISNMNQAMMGYLEMAQELLDLRGHEELIERPLEIIRHSSRLIASVKKLEQAQAGKYPLKAVDLGALLAKVTAAYASVKGREIRINYAPVAGCYVRASDLLEDVLDHLVENAVRHSQGPLTVDVAVVPLVQDGGRYYQVSVADNGPGIPDELKRKVFRLVDEATGSPGRRGLGLFMVRTLVEGYRGKVWVEDRVPGDYRQGSRFVVLLPAADQTAGT